MNLINRNCAQINSDFSTNENFEELLNTNSTDSLKEGQLKHGRVVGEDSEAYYVDIGLKSEGRIPKSEFIIQGELKTFTVGDEIDVFLEKYENKMGKVALSYEKAIRELSWEWLKKAVDEKTPIDGIIIAKVKGGFSVELNNGVIAFLPGSQVDVKPVKDVTPLFGKTQPFIVIKAEDGNIVVSRRAVLEESRSEARDELLSKIHEGVELTGTVKNITDYGAFVDLGSVDGLLHITDFSWNRISHPSEMLSVGQEVKVVVIKYNPETKRISLGMKQLETNPWEGLDKEFVKGSIHKGKVTNITDYGVFVELKPGIEGLVHVSEISWTKLNQHPRKIVNAGQEVEYMVLDIDVDKHRISLGMKQCQENPWQKFADAHPVGTIVEGEIKNIVEFGLFIGFDSGVDGLVHVSDLSWAENPIPELKKYNKDQKIQAIVLTVDPDKERISLGVKQLSEDPFEKDLKDIKKGKVITCTVLEVKDDGIEVCIADNIACSIKKNELSSDRMEQRTERFAVGDKVDAKVIAFDKATRKVSLSVRAMEFDEHKKVMAEYGSSDSGASLGDILGTALSNNKKEEN